MAILNKTSDTETKKIRYVKVITYEIGSDGKPVIDPSTGEPKTIITKMKKVWNQEDTEKKLLYSADTYIYAELNAAWGIGWPDTSAVRSGARISIHAVATTEAEADALTADLKVHCKLEGDFGTYTENKNGVTRNTPDFEPNLELWSSRGIVVTYFKLEMTAFGITKNSATADYPGYAPSYGYTSVSIDKPI